jgi:hypothetical protein
MKNRTNFPLYVILALVAISTLVLEASLADLHSGNGTGYSAPALYNQANGDAQKGNIGLAVANYERARLLAPDNADIAANLKWVREHAGLQTATPSLIDRATSWASPNTMALLGWMGLVLVGAGILSAQSIPQFRLGSRLAAGAGIALLTLSLASAIAAWQTSHQAVVLTQDAAARIAPVSNGETSFKLHPGEMVSIDGHYNDFTLVKNSAGHSGWVAQNDITPVIPQ